jgi:hypothetical protein
MILHQRTRRGSLCRWSILALAVQSTFSTGASKEFVDMSLEALADCRLMSMSRKEPCVAPMP